MRKTNWDLYYEKPFKTAMFSRKITGNLLTFYIKKYCKRPVGKVLEIGGANSCFFDVIQKRFSPAWYTVMDNNQYGLDKFCKRLQEQGITSFSTVNNDILNPQYDEKFDLVFSVGLVEHFSLDGTKKAIENHFRYVKDEGIVIIGFPTPTFLYKTVRKLAEVAGIWMFPDERPITINEAKGIFENKAIVLENKVLWPIFLTQAFFVLKKVH